MKIQFGENEALEATRSPYHSETQLVIYLAPYQIALDKIVEQAKASDKVYFFSNDELLATFSHYTEFTNATLNDSEIALTMTNPNPEDLTSQYVKAAKIILGDNTDNIVERAEAIAAAE